MSPEKQRIAIAEACGWRTQPNSQGKRWEHISALEDGWFYESELPDYLSDLNATHEAEKMLIKAQQVTAYVTALCHLCEHATPMQMIWHATAAQRAEAFLRTIGKWEDDK